MYFLNYGFPGENTYNEDQSDAHQSTFSSSKEVILTLVLR